MATEVSVAPRETKTEALLEQKEKYLDQLIKSWREFRTKMREDPSWNLNNDEVFFEMWLMSTLAGLFALFSDSVENVNGLKALIQERIYPRR